MFSRDISILQMNAKTSKWKLPVGWVSVSAIMLFKKFFFCYATTHMTLMTSEVAMCVRKSCLLFLMCLIFLMGLRVHTNPTETAFSLIWISSYVQELFILGFAPTFFTDESLEIRYYYWGSCVLFYAKVSQIIQGY